MATSARSRQFVWMATTAAMLGAVTMAGCSKPASPPQTAGSVAANPSALHVGDTLNAGRYSVKISSVAITDTYVEGGSTFHAQPGATLVIVHFEIANPSVAPISYMGLPDIHLMDARSNLYDPDPGKLVYFALDKTVDESTTGDLNPGMTRHDAVAFEVSKSQFDASTWKVVAGDDKLHGFAISTADTSPTSGAQGAVGSQTPPASTPASGETTRIIFSCVTASGKQVRFLDRGESVEYSYGKPGSSPDVDLFAKKTDVEMGMVAGMGHHINFKTPTASYHVEQFKHADQTLSVTKGYWSESAPETQRYLSSIKCASGVVDNIPDE